MTGLYYLRKVLEIRLRNSKLGAFIFIMFFACMNYMSPVKDMVQAVNYPVSWCVFPFLLTDHVFLCLFYFGIIYINSDIPFLQYEGMYQMIRTGRIRWAAANMAGIAVRSFLAVLVTAVCSVLSLLPDIELTNEWGKLLRTAAMSNMAAGYKISFGFFYEILGEYTPLGLMGLVVLLLTLISIFLGLLMFAVSLVLNRSLAVVIDMLLCLMTFLVLNMGYSSRLNFAVFIPTIWAQAARRATPGMGYYWLPRVSYMVTALILGCFACMAVVFVKIKRIDLNWVNEDS